MLTRERSEDRPTTVLNPIKQTLRSRLSELVNNFLTPDLDLTKLAYVDVVVVHGGSGKHGVATAIVFQDQVDTAKREAQGLSLEDEDFDFRPPILFVGRWSPKTPDNQKPRLKNGRIAPQAIYMQELAYNWGVPKRLVLTEDQSDSTRIGVLNAIHTLQNLEVNPKVAVLITPHMFPKRVFMLWQHYSKGVEFLPTGAFVIQGDDEPAYSPQDPLQERIRRKDRIKELVKTVATRLFIKSRIW